MAIQIRNALRAMGAAVSLNLCFTASAYAPPPEPSEQELIIQQNTLSGFCTNLTGSYFNQEKDKIYAMCNVPNSTHALDVDMRLLNITRRACGETYNELSLAVDITRLSETRQVNAEASEILDPVITRMCAAQMARNITGQEDLNFAAAAAGAEQPTEHSPLWMYVLGGGLALLGGGGIWLYNRSRKDQGGRPSSQRTLTGIERDELNRKTGAAPEAEVTVASDSYGPPEPPPFPSGASHPVNLKTRPTFGGACRPPWTWDARGPAHPDYQ